MFILAAFVLGVAAGAAGYKNIAHWLAKRPPNAAPEPYDRDRELLRDAFTDELITGEPLVNPPCKTAQDVHDQLADQFLIQPDDFNTDMLFQNLVVQEMQPATAPAAGANDGPEAIKLEYWLGPRVDSQLSHYAWAYRLRGPHATKPVSILIIPGSGMNEASRIARGDPKDYHGDIAALCRQVGDVYVLVKPNEDFAAIHDGKHKLSYQFITNALLNRDLSYSAEYLCAAVAMVKRLGSGKVLVVGLSQGGTAAMLVAMKSHPAAAVVASGYSVTTDVVDPGGPNQIILPKLRNWWRPSADGLKFDLGRLHTQFLFTYGKAEKGAYRVEAQEGVTQKFFAGLNNVKFVAHEGGHEFPRAAVLDFLKEQAAKTANSTTNVTN